MTKSKATSKVRRPRLTTLQRRYAQLVHDYVVCTGSISDHLRILEEQRMVRMQIEERVRTFVRTAKVAA